MTEMNKLYLVEILNPFKPNEQRRSTLEFVPGASVESLFPLLVTNELQVGLNGKIIDPSERAVTYVAEGDYLVICPIVAGGGGDSKSILRIVALIAISVVTAGAGAAVGGALMGADAIAFAAAYGATGVAMANGAMMMAGGMLVSALIPAPTSTKANNTSTYGIDGAKNTAVEGLVVPIVYGKFRTAGNIINNYTVNDGDTQWLYVLVNAGEGPIQDISDIWINDQPISTFDVATTPYKDVDYQIRLGEAVQGPIDWFATTITPQSVNFRLTTNWHTTTTLGVVDQLRLDFSCPAGLTQGDIHGDANKRTVSMDVEYRVHTTGGTGAWASLGGAQSVDSYIEETVWLDFTTIPAGQNQSPSTVRYVPTGAEVRVGDIFYETAGSTVQVGAVRQVAVYAVAAFSITANQTSAVRRSMLTAALPEAVYDVRVRRTDVERSLTDSRAADAVLFTDLNEIVLETVTYVNTALVAVKIRLGDQLNGMPKITYMHHGKKVRVWNESTGVFDFKGSSSPAWISYDILTNKIYGGGALSGRFDFAAWREWATWTLANGLEFNGVFDTQSNVWDSNQKVMRCGHASIVRVGTRYTLAIERDTSPVMMFSVGNMVSGSFEESWSSVSERANEIEGTYADQDDDYKQRTIRVYDKNAVAIGTPQRTASVDLMGVTKAQQAWNDLNILLNLNRYIQRTVKFSCTMDALGCTVGSVVTVQHDMPQWGTGGRLEAGSTTSLLQLDRSITLTNGVTYKALVHHTAVQRYSGTTGAVVNVADQSMVILGGYDGSTLPARLQVAGKDMQVLSKFTSGSSHGVVTGLIAGLGSGAAYSLWDTDVIETRDVVNAAVPGTPITATTALLASPLSIAPGQYMQFMFGPTDKVAKPFRIKTISGSHDYHRDIVATEFNSTVYSAAGAVPTINYSSLPLFVDQVTIIGTSEQIVLNGVVYKSRVTVSYQSTQQTYQASDVYLSRNGGAYQWVGRDIYSVTVEASKGESLRFRVVATDVLGKGAPESSAPTITVVVRGKVAPSQDVTNFVAVPTENGDYLVSWDASTYADYLETEVHIESSWNDATDPLFRGKADSCLWSIPAAGTYTILAKHRDTSGNVSLNVASITKVVIAYVKPTRNKVTQGFTAPTSPSDGDIWIETDITGTNKIQAWYRVEGAWSKTAASGIAVLLSNEAQTLSASDTGAVDSFVGADSFMAAFNGPTDETSLWTFAKADINVHSNFEPGAPNHVVVDGFGGTRLMLHGDGTVGSSGVVDSSICANTIINPGTEVVLTASNAKYAQAILFPGTSASYLEVDWIPDFKLSNLEFAIQLQAYIPSMFSTRQFVIGWWGAGSNTADHSWAILIGANGKLNFDYSSAYDNADFTIASTAVIPTGVVTEIGVGRVGNILTLKVGTTLETFSFNKTIRTIGSIYSGSQPDNFLLPQVFNYL